MASKHEDERGVIQDLLGPVDAVTEIKTVKGAVRGNHVHFDTTQWTYVVSGRLQVFTRERQSSVIRCDIYHPGQVACEKPGIAHAWKALDDVTCLVFTKGPRSGEDYELDTYRLTGDDRLIVP